MKEILKMALVFEDEGFHALDPSQVGKVLVIEHPACLSVEIQLAMF
jgi:hypothetical protein